FAGGMGNADLTAGGQVGPIPGYQPPGVLLVADEMQHRDHEQADRLVKVNEVTQVRVAEDRVWIAQVRVDVSGGTPGVADQESAGVGEHDWVVVDVDNPGCGI